MIISPINFNFVHSAKVNNNFNQNKYSSSIPNDAFIRSNNINFKGKVPKTDYLQFKEELIQYVYNSDEIDFSEIEKIAQKICPEVTVDDMKNLQKDVTYGTAAYTEQPFILKQDSSGYLRAEIGSQKMFLAKPKDNSREEKIIFLDRILHEFTHVLQESKSNEKIADIINKRKLDDVDIVSNSLRVAQQLFMIVESNMLEKTALILKNPQSLPNEVPDNFNYVNSFRKKYKNTTPQADVRNNIKSVMKKVKNYVDESIVFEIMNYKAKAEKEAYSHALEFDKEALGLENKKTDFDIRLEMYDALINATNK